MDVPGCPLLATTLDNLRHATKLSGRPSARTLRRMAVTTALWPAIRLSCLSRHNQQHPAIFEEDVAFALPMPAATGHSLYPSSVKGRYDLVNAAINATHPAVQGHADLMPVGQRTARFVTELAYVAPGPVLSVACHPCQPHSKVN